MASFAAEISAAKTFCQQRIAKLREVILPTDFVAGFRSVIEFGRVHQLEVLLVLAAGANRHFIEPFAKMVVRSAANLAKVRKNWSWPVTPGDGTKPRIENESIKSS